MKVHIDVIIVGAGPYGLSIAAELQHRGIDCRIVGHPMYSWLHQTPDGMLLKSPGFASSLYHPDGRFTIQHYCHKRNLPYADVDYPIPVEVFRAYGMTFQKRFAPHVEEDRVTSLAGSGECFTLHLEGGKTILSRRVIVATGLDHFRQVPAMLTSLPPDLTSHSADHRNMRRFMGQKVAVIGAGASAVNLAVLFHEADTTVELIARRPTLAFGSPWLPARRSLWRRLREPLSGIGPGWKSKLYADLPGLYRYLPDESRLRIARTHLGPSGGWFMKERAAAVPTRLGCKLDSATPAGDRVRLHLIDAHGCDQYVSVDHVIAATGYFVDVRRLPFLDQGLVRQLDLVGGSPRLSAHFESSIPGLYFVGPAAAASFGPVMRFVAGCGFAARRLGKHLAGRRSTGISPAAQPTMEVES